MARGSLAEIRKPCIRPGCKACASGKKHPALVYMFMENGRQHCMYVPRELRPLVIARKLSFGSQSDAGARTREILMTVLHTLKKRSSNVEAAFKAALDKIAANQKTDRYTALFFQNSS
ncbi:MAG: hypothetical protein PHP98_08140 [Kiritimatiellae bacterium]|nr:hypothetical protein [Kiritimatiellia bacterium]